MSELQILLHDEAQLLDWKQCSKCGEAKPRAEFHKRSVSRDGLRSQCKACCLLMCASWRASNPEKLYAKARTEITQSRLMCLLNYDEKTGVFRWKISPSNRAAVGSVAGSLHNRGYRQINIDGTPRLAHRLAWLYVYGEFPEDQIDHVNGVRTDNRIANLRKATNAQNNQNQRSAHARNTSGKLGVSIFRNNKFLAQIGFNGKSHYLGYYDSAEDAHEAYVKAKRKLHEFGTL